MPHETSFNAIDNPYTESEFLKICEDYGIPNDPMRYRDEKFYWSYQRGVHWPDDYLGPDSMTRWIIETSVSFTDVGLLKISESAAFLNNFENVVNRRVNIQEDIKRYQHTLSYTSSKVNYIIGESIYMLPSDIELKIKTGTVGYNNKILVSDGKFILGKNEKVKFHVNHVKQTAVTHRDSETAVTHKDLEKS